MKILVTGSDGFVGAPLCRRLAEDGHEVVALTRNPRELGPGILNRPAGDLRDISRWDELVHGCNAVVHLAAHVHRVNATARDRDAFRDVNVRATAKLVSAANREGVDLFAFLSTVKVHGEDSGSSAFDESSPLAPEDDYGKSKLEAEDEIRRSGGPYLILRPPLVYGPGVKANFLSLLAAVRARRPLPLAGIDNRRSLLYVGNLVDVIARCLVTNLQGETTFLVRDGRDVSSAELVRQMASAIGVEPRLFRIPETLLRVAGAMLGQGARVRRLTGSLAIDDSRVRRVLGWTPPFSLSQGLEETAGWFAAAEVKE